MPKIFDHTQQKCVNETVRTLNVSFTGAKLVKEDGCRGSTIDDLFTITMTMSNMNVDVTPFEALNINGQEDSNGHVKIADTFKRDGVDEGAELVFSGKSKAIPVKLTNGLNPFSFTMSTQIDVNKGSLGSKSAEFDYYGTSDATITNIVTGEETTNVVPNFMVDHVHNGTLNFSQKFEVRSCVIDLYYKWYWSR